MRSRLKLTALSVIALSCLCPAAAAQSDAYISMMRTQNQQMASRTRIYSSVRSGARITRYGDKSARQGGSSTSRGRTTGGTTTGARTPPVAGQPHSADTTFRPVASTIVPQQLARASAPAERREAEKFFARLLGAHTDMARSKGVPTNDVARAASFALSSFQYVASGGSDLSASQLEALRRQTRELFAADAGFQAMSDREKQEMYESYIIQGMFVSSVFDGASQRGDRKKVEQLREMARLSLQEILGAPADKISFTDDGVEFR